jgi:hypothetical protein
MTRYYLVRDPHQDTQLWTAKVSFDALVTVTEVTATQIGCESKPHLNLSPRLHAMRELENIAKAVRLYGQIDGQLRPTLNRYALRVELDGSATDLHTGERYVVPIGRLAPKPIGQVPNISLKSVLKLKRIYSLKIIKSRSSVKLPLIERTVIKPQSKRSTPSSAQLPSNPESPKKIVMRSRTYVTALNRTQSRSNIIDTM